MKRPCQATSALSLVLIVLSGCGSAENEQVTTTNSEAGRTEAAAAALDPCSLLTSEAVASVIAEKVVRAQAEGDSCTYETEDAMASAVRVQIKRQGAAEEMEAIRRAGGVLAGIGGEMKGGEGAAADVGEALAKKQATPGLGDESLFDANSALHVRKGNAYLMIAPPTMRSRMGAGNPLLSAQERQGMAVALARQAMSKI